jgi:hypothetical protein
MKDSILHLHTVCEDWKKELKFFKEEIRQLRSRLGDIVSKNQSKDILVQVDHFENKFDILESHVKNLIHEVKSKDRVLLSQVAAQPQAAKTKMVNTDQTIEDMMLVTSKDFYDTKNEYHRFLSLVYDDTLV